MKWYNEKNEADGIIISSRIRLARNLSDTPFPQRCPSETRQKVCDRVRDSLEKHSFERFNYISMNTQSSLDKTILLEDHLISPEFAEGDGNGRLLITDEQSLSSLMVNEEDHLRIQVIRPGLDLRSALSRALSLDDLLTQGLPIAFDETLGYLTACPTNLGTGMRASVMLHLPALTSCSGIKSLVSLMTKIGLTVRGLYGEGSEADGCLYQISNQITLGISENDAVEKLESAVRQVAEREKQLRESLVSEGGIDLEDSVYRSFGVMRSARKLSSKEFLKLWSDVKFGTEAGLIKETEGTNLTKLLIEAMPGHVARRITGDGDGTAPAARDIKRAELVRNHLKNFA